MHPFFRNTCAIIMRSPVMSFRLSRSDTGSRGTSDHRYHVADGAVVVMSVISVREREERNRHDRVVLVKRARPEISRAHHLDARDPPLNFSRERNTSMAA